MNQKPSIGRIVHYVSRGSADGVYPPRHVPLAVVDVFGPEGTIVSGWTLNPKGQRYEESVTHDESAKPGTWHWPERA